MLHHFTERNAMPTRRIAEPLAQRIGARIRDLRLQQRKSLEALETACGVSKGHLSNIERGTVVMNVDTLWKIAQGLGVGMAELVSGLDDLSR